ncbi:hypothetical protein EDB83DRAFT_2322515 [Lactarius deliciosus]|nr:hypothetical protein EDB83DRAFT_2322515 [Lactarius deliciosus]
MREKSWAEGGYRTRGLRGKQPGERKVKVRNVLRVPAFGPDFWEFHTKSLRGNKRRLGAEYIQQEPECWPYSVVKMKVDNPTANFYLISLGTDRLETFFGLICTALRNHASGLTEVAAILAEHPKWDYGMRHLSLPIFSKDTQEFTSKADHINPRDWCGNVSVANVNLHTCWLLGWKQTEELIPDTEDILDALSGSSPSIVEMSTSDTREYEYSSEILEAILVLDSYLQQQVLISTSTRQVSRTDTCTRAASTRLGHEYSYSFELHRYLF